MQLVDIILDKRISCTFIDDTNVENVIFCRPLEESLNNISLITTKDNEFIHNYLEESTGNYLVTNVFLDDGTVYEDVRFRLVTIEEGRELPASTINLSTLGLPSATDVLPPSRLIEEEYNLTLENAEENDDFSVIYNVPEVVDNTEIVQKIKSLESKLVTEQQKLEQEKIKLNKERITLENERRLSKALEDYKAELLQETFLVSNHQKELLEKSIQDLSKSFQEQFDSQQINVEKYLDTLSLANLEEVKKYQDIQVGKIKDQINNLLSERQDENALTTDKLLLERTSELESIFTEKLITELEDHKRNVKTEIDGINNALDNLIGEKLQENNDKVDRLLVNRAGVLQDQFNEKLTKDLTDHKNSLFNEFKTVSTETSSLLFTEKTEELNNALTIVLDEHKKNLNTTVTSKINEIGSTVNNFKTEIDGKLPQLDETIKEINKRIQTLVIEKKNVQVLADDARKYTDIKVAQASEEMMNYARRILDLGGGGGSVAVQYANGGTMNGDLNVTGQYLSGGVDIGTLFGGSNSGNSAVNSLVISNSSNWNNSYTTLTANSASWVTYSNLNTASFVPYSAINTVSANWNNSYTTLTANSASWNGGSAAYTNLVSNSAAYLSAVNISFLSVSGNWNNTYNTVSALSSNWSGAYTIIQSSSGNWAADYTAYTLLTANSGNWQSTYTTVSSNSSNWQTGYNNAIYNVNGTANQITVTPAGNNTGNNSVTVSLPSSVNVSTLNVLNSLNVAGSASFYNTNNLNVSSNIIYYGEGNTGNTLDLGLVTHFVGNLNNGQNKYQHTGLVRKAGQNSPSIWTLFSGLTTEPGDVNSGINWSDPYLTLDTLSANVLGNLSGSYVTVGGGNSNQWNTAYASTTALNLSSGNWNSVYTSWNAASATSILSFNNTRFAKLSAQVYQAGSNINSIQPINGHNNASGYYSNVAGGGYNTASGLYSNVAGGSSNNACGRYSNVAGGQGNNASGCYSNVAGGCGNTASGYASNVAGGQGNNASGNSSNVAGGNGNNASGCYSNVAGGRGNTASSYFSNVAGGRGNTASGRYSNVAGGCCNTICSLGSGASNTSYTTIAGGICNNISSTSSGYYNSSSCTCTQSYSNTNNSAILGGNGNVIRDCNLVYNTSTSSAYSTIIGGSTNCINYNSPYNLIGGGCNNRVYGCYNTIVNGTNNSLSGSNNFTLGSNISVSASNYTFVNNLSSQGVVAAANLTINKAPQTFVNPLTASGTFLVVNVNGTNQAIQLWNYSS